MGEPLDRREVRLPVRAARVRLDREHAIGKSLGAGIDPEGPVDRRAALGIRVGEGFEHEAVAVLGRDHDDGASGLRDAARGAVAKSERLGGVEEVALAVVDEVQAVGIAPDEAHVEGVGGHQALRRAVEGGVPLDLARGRVGEEAFGGEEGAGGGGRNHSRTRADGSKRMESDGSSVSRNPGDA